MLQGVQPHPVEKAQLRIAVDRHSLLSIASPQTAIRVRDALSREPLDMVRLFPEAELLSAFGSSANVRGVFVQYTLALRAEEVRALLTTKRTHRRADRTDRSAATAAAGL
jgi:hypothetical protein